METIEKRKRIISAILNIIIVIFEIIAGVLSFKTNQFKMFVFYTEDSNYFAGFASLLLAIFQIKSILHKKGEIPISVKILKYISVCLLMITFTVVIFILCPMYGGLDAYKIMLLSGSMLYQHLLCPILSFISFAFFERGFELNKKATFIALIPTCIYAIILILLNVFEIVKGPYPFLMVYNQPFYISCLWVLLILGIAFVFANIIWKLNNETQK